MRAFDVAIVLGAAVNPDGTPSKALLRRTQHAIALYRKGIVSRLLLSGGAVRAARAEALLMRDVALAAGLPEAAVVVETQSRSTLENALFCRPILEEAGWRRILVVTDGYHLRRALYTFGRLGMPAEGSAAPKAGWRPTQLLATLREIPARFIYRRRIARMLNGRR